MELDNFDTDLFLRDHWQKQPLFIRNPWRNWHNPVEPDELAGLACEDDIEARLIIETENGTGSAWTLEDGPFDSAKFAQLGKSHWTLLVQAVDQYVPPVSALIEPFRFIPDWRIDDIMVSYAVDQGGVGPHFDQYDVFLIQGLGRRRWQVGAKCDGDTELAPHDDLRQLARFRAEHEWICEPGDILYVPPGFSHHGVAIGDDCMTYSIGFRAPSRSELIAHFCDHLLDELHDDDRYSDPELQVQKNPGEISPAAIDKLHAMVLTRMQDRDAFARWFGQENTLPKYSGMNMEPEEAIDAETARRYVADRTVLCRNPASRFSYIRYDEHSVALFADGVCYECHGETMKLAVQLCADVQCTVDVALAHSDDGMHLLARLFNQGSLSLA